MHFFQRVSRARRVHQEDAGLQSFKGSHVFDGTHTLAVSRIMLLGGVEPNLVFRDGLVVAAVEAHPAFYSRPLPENADDAGRWLSTDRSAFIRSAAE